MGIFRTRLDRGLFVAVCVMSFLATGVGALAVYDDAHPNSLTWVAFAREHVDLMVAD